MTDERPAPFTGADVDLSGYGYMPLHGHRMLQSETWIKNSAPGKVAALALWWASWLQVPAASLPNDDVLLAHYAGYGVAVEAFAAIRHEAMRGWVLCSDNRWHHKFLAEIAAEAWAGRVKHQAKKAADQARYEAKKAAEEANSAGKKDNSARKDGNSTPEAQRNPTEKAPKGEERRGEEREGIKNNTPTGVLPLDGGSAIGATIADFEAFWTAYPRSPNDSKKTAKQRWDTLHKAKALPVIADMLRAVQAYKDWLASEQKRRPKDPVPVAHASTWLNQRRFDGFIEAAKTAAPGQPPKDPQTIEKLRREKIPPGEWEAAAQRFADAYGWGVWDMATSAAQLIDGDPLEIRFNNPAMRDLNQRNGWTEKLRRAAGEFLKISVKPMGMKGI